MSFMRNIGLLVILIIGLASSCKDSESDSNNSKEKLTPRIIKNTKVVSPASNAKLVIGDTVHFKLEHRQEPIDSISLEYGTFSQTFVGSEFKFVPSKPKTGNQKFRLKAHFGLRKEESHYPRVTILSDVVPDQFSYQIVNTYPHDPKAYTQGLFFKDDTLVESTGQNGSSWLAKINYQTSEKYLQKPLESKYFGEGSTFWNNQYIQLTWESQVGFVYDQQFNQKRTFNYSHQGWGITAWGDTLYVSDGSHVIHLLDPRDFTEFDKLEVYDNKDKVRNINELEMINGELYANVYLKDYILVIDPLSGKVLRKLNMDGLLTTEESRNADVLNGIAYKANEDRVFVTGKLWPKLFEVKFVPIN